VNLDMSFALAVNLDMSFALADNSAVRKARRAGGDAGTRVHPLRRAGGERVARGWGRGGGGAESEGGGAVWRGVVSGIVTNRPPLFSVFGLRRRARRLTGTIFD